MADDGKPYSYWYDDTHHDDVARPRVHANRACEVAARMQHQVAFEPPRWIKNEGVRELPCGRSVRGRCLACGEYIRPDLKE